MARKAKKDAKTLPTLSELTSEERREAWDTIPEIAGEETTIGTDEFGNRTAYVTIEFASGRSVVVGIEISPDWEDWCILN